MCVANILHSNLDIIKNDKIKVEAKKMLTGDYKKYEKTKGSIKLE